MSKSVFFSSGGGSDVYLQDSDSVGVYASEGYDAHEGKRHVRVSLTEAEVRDWAAALVFVADELADAKAERERQAAADKRLAIQRTLDEAFYASTPTPHFRGHGWPGTRPISAWLAAAGYVVVKDES